MKYQYYKDDINDCIWRKSENGGWSYDYKSIGIWVGVMFDAEEQWGLIHITEEEAFLEMI